MTEAQTRQQLYDSMVISQNITDAHGGILISNIPAKIKAKTGLMLSNRDKYQTIASKFLNQGLKWWLIAVIHEMECTQNFYRHLHNGDPLINRTVHVPAGRPVKGTPPFSFTESAIDALTFQGADKIQDWSVGNVLYFLEGYNGYGYTKYHGINSPYIWSGSNQYTSGKYVSDGNYDANAVSLQIGIALLLKTLIDK